MGMPQPYIYRPRVFVKEGSQPEPIDVKKKPRYALLEIEQVESPWRLVFPSDAAPTVVDVEY